MASAGKPTLVSSEWLHDQLKNNKGVSRSVRILDTTFDRYRKLDTYKDCYLKEHVPTALFFDLHKCVQSTSEIPRNLPEANSFTEYVRSLGVWPDTHVIVYDRDDLVPAFRTWWLFRRSNFSINMNKTLLHSYEDMFDNVAKSKNRQIVDSRMKNDPKMIDLAIDGGIIPNSKIVSYTDLFNEDQTMKSPPMLKALFDVAGVDTCSPMVVTCNTGMTACCVAAAMHILGQDIPVYYGSWTEWRQRAPEELKQRVNADD
ncbi:thiosulfate sulfurtransferase-like isoform X2 [Mercenaria mercenaria]|uniref:thiosulfate sulfurtransferase-like isoform X2 n=1 Tax=Mercenaria mercenaria TaxID=6596 RepID=UPI00234E9C64|nr:thiosulfate sulfurtransferase-like isoform X2 [Mercenaria mercenaria]